MNTTSPSTGIEIKDHKQQQEEEKITMGPKSETSFHSDDSLRDMSEQDSFTADPNDTGENGQSEQVEILGLELLFAAQKLSDSNNTDNSYCDGDSRSSGSSLEVDSLVLTRRRLPRIRHKWTKRNRAQQDCFESEVPMDFEVPLGEPLSKISKTTLETDSETSSSTSSFDDWESLTVDSLILARRRLPKYLRHKPNGTYLEDFEVPLGTPLSGIRKQKTEIDSETSSTSSDDDWESLTVDSLILARQRLATARQSKSKSHDKQQQQEKHEKGSSTDVREIKQLKLHPKHHHTRYTKFDDMISKSHPNNGGFNCAA